MKPALPIDHKGRQASHCILTRPKVLTCPHTGLEVQYLGVYICMPYRSKAVQLWLINFFLFLTTYRGRLRDQNVVQKLEYKNN